MASRQAAGTYAALAVLAVAPCVLGGVARAEPAGPRVQAVVVLEIDSDDAEDQAEALTSALRSRVRTVPGYSLTETSQSMSALVIGLKCPKVPDPPCLQRVGDQLKSDRFVWGTMTRGPAAQAVTADVHLWTRSKGDTHVKESYSDNLKDPGDESLRRLAARLFDKLSGATSPGVVVLQSPDEHAAVYVDGQPRATIERGVARLELTPGPHEIEVRAEGKVPVAHAAQVLSGSEVTVALLAARPPDAAAAPREPAKPFPVRQVAGWSAVGLGAVSLVVGVVQGARFFSAKSSLDAERAKVPSNLTDVCSEEAQSNANAVIACRHADDARGARTTGLVFGGVGLALAAVGTYLLVTDKSTKETASPGALRVVPALGPAGGGLDVAVTF